MSWQWGFIDTNGKFLIHLCQKYAYHKYFRVKDCPKKNFFQSQGVPDCWSNCIIWWNLSFFGRLKCLKIYLKCMDLKIEVNFKISIWVFVVHDCITKCHVHNCNSNMSQIPPTQLAGKQDPNLRIFRKFVGQLKLAEMHQSIVF